MIPSIMCPQPFCLRLCVDVANALIEPSKLSDNDLSIVDHHDKEHRSLPSKRSNGLIIMGDRENNVGAEGFRRSKARVALLVHQCSINFLSMHSFIDILSILEEENIGIGVRCAALFDSHIGTVHRDE